LVGAADLREIVKVFASLPDLEFPINSAGEFIEKLGGSDKTLAMAGIEVDPMRMIKYMPAYYFPIPTIENFIEKLAELVRANRKQVNIPKELETIRHQLPEMRFPIENAGELVRMLGSRHRYKFQGRDVYPEEIIKRIPAEFFPVASKREFESKIIRLMAALPLIEKH
jgi:hypothetical protein